MNRQHPAAAPAPRRNWVRRLANLLVALVVIAMAAATFVFSYDGVHAIALLGGMSPKLARYYPGLFDAVLVIACVAAVVLRDARWWARAWAWVVLIVVLAAIGATDVVHAMSYTLRQRTTEGIVAAAPVVAVLLAFSLLLTLLRQSRSQGAGAAAGDEPGEWPTGPEMTLVPPDLPALEAAPPAATAATGDNMADAPTVETQALTAGPAIRPPAPPIALPPGQETAPLTPPDGLPAVTRQATEPDGTLPPAAPPLASQRAPEGEPAPPTVSSPALAPVLPPPAPAAAEPGPARPHGIRYAGSGAARGGDEAGAAEPAAQPGATATEPDDPDEDYWDGDDARQFAGLVYPAREGNPGAETAASRTDAGDGTRRDEDFADHPAGNDDDTEAGGQAPKREPMEIDEDAPPFATAPFATVPRLNRVRSMPVPPEEDDESE
jgi:Protein of unknown function (DUF2637)